jgi:hypothetical protein
MKITRSAAVGLAACWTILVFVLLSLPGRAIPESNLPDLDKVVHAGLFAIGVFLWLLVPRRSSAARWVIILGALALAPLTEVWQAMLNSGRTPDPLDALADATGVLIGVAARYLHLRVGPSGRTGSERDAAEPRK